MKKTKLLLALCSFFIAGAHYACAYGKKFSELQTESPDGAGARDAGSTPDDRNYLSVSEYSDSDLKAMYRRFLADNDLCGVRLNKKYQHYYLEKYGIYIQKALLHYYNLALIDNHFDVPLQWYGEKKECFKLLKFPCPKDIQLLEIPKPLLESKHEFVNLLIHFFEHKHRNHQKAITRGVEWFPKVESQLVYFAVVGEIVSHYSIHSDDYTRYLEKYFLNAVIAKHNDLSKKLIQMLQLHVMTTESNILDCVKILNNKLEVEIDEGVCSDSTDEVYAFFSFCKADPLIKKAVSHHFYPKELQTIQPEDCQRLMNKAGELQDPTLRKAVLLPVVYTLENNSPNEESWQQLRSVATAFSEYQALIDSFSYHMKYGLTWFSLFYHHYLNELINHIEKRIISNLKQELNLDTDCDSNHTLYLKKVVAILSKGDESTLLNQLLSKGVEYIDKLFHYLQEKGINLLEQACNLLKEALSPDVPYNEQRVSFLTKMGGMLSQEDASILLKRALTPGNNYDHQRVSVLREMGGTLSEKDASTLLKRASATSFEYIHERALLLRDLGGMLSEKDASTLLKRALSSSIHYVEQRVSFLIESGGTLTEKDASTLLKLALNPSVTYVEKRVSVLMEFGGHLSKEEATKLRKRASAIGVVYDAKRISTLEQLGGTRPNTDRATPQKQASTSSVQYDSQRVPILEDMGS